MNSIFKTSAFAVGFGVIFVFTLVNVNALTGDMTKAIASIGKKDAQAICELSHSHDTCFAALNR